jgi:hypothetical protein
VTTSRVMEACRNKVSFWPIPEIMETDFRTY